MQKQYWVTPPEVYKKLDDEFHFDFDPCPNPRPEGFDGLTCDWGKMNWVNPPFTGEARVAGKRKLGPMAWAKKAILEQSKGNSSVIIFPTYQGRVCSYLEDCGAEVRFYGKVRWLALDDLSPNPCKVADLTQCLLFILK